MPKFVCNHCGCENTVESDRSPKAHRHFFACVKAAFDNWPLKHTFLPSCEEHLRAYLLVQAEHCNVIGQNLHDEADIMRVADFTERLLAAVRHFGGYGFVDVVSRKSIAVRYPRSIAFREIGQKAFHEIAQRVFEIIEVEVGVPVDQLVREHEAAA